ncbi:acyltransferase [Streptomyces sp. NPDC046821]|uniref:acyltransferase family protein n=1 Tax=Streptomyces sp. NPDC046821 TaxID=3154702 RepID=UPI0033EEDA75
MSEPAAVSKPAVPPQIHSLTGLRFVAAVVVFVTHGAMLFVLKDQGATWMYMFFAGKVGQISLTYFFVLSGFVLTWTHRPGNSVTGFWRRRFFRIYPSHAVTFAAAVVLLWLFGEHQKLGPTLTNLFLLQDWVPDNAYMDSANGVSWSLSAELLFYLAFPVLVAAILKIRANRLWFWVGGTALAVILVPVASLAWLPDSPQWSWGPASWAQIWFVNVFPVSRLLEFVIGIMLARMVQTGMRSPLGVTPAVLLVVASYAAQLFLPVHFLFSYAAIQIVPVALLILALAASDLKGRKSFLNTPAMVYLGNLTFAFYLVHNLVLRFGHRAFGVEPNAYGQLGGPQWSGPVAVAFLAAAFVVSLLLSWVLFVLVERPAVARWSRPAAKRAPKTEHQDTSRSEVPVATGS